MIRSGASIALGAGSLVWAGNFAAGVLCAVFSNLLIFMDQAGPLWERVTVISVGAAAVTAGCALGAALSGSEPAVVAAALGFALAAGVIHSSVPGLDMAPRQALIGFLVCAYLPQLGAAIWPSAAVAGGFVLAGAAIDSAFRERVVGPSFLQARERRLPGLRFGLAFGAMAAVGLLLASEFGATRPYWVTITTVVVMQPDRRSSVQRAVQRFAGTIIGVCLAFLIARTAAWLNETAILYAAALLLPFVWPLGFARNHSLGIMLLTAWVLVLLDLAQPSPQDAGELFLARLSDTALGCALAVLGTVLAYAPEPGPARSA